MSESAPARPPQVSMAAGMAVVGAAMLLLAAFNALSGLPTLDTQSAVRSYLHDHHLGWSVDGTISGLRVALTALAVTTAAAGVCAVFAWQRHRGARILLAVLAAPGVLGYGLLSPIAPVLLAFGAGLLWTPVANDWFAGRPPRTYDVPRPTPTGRPPVVPPRLGELPPPTGPRYPDLPPPAGARHHDLPPPPGYAPGGYPSAARPGPTAAGYAPPPAPAPVPQRTIRPGTVTSAPGDRPLQVSIACGLTWVSCGLTAMLGLAFAVVLAVEPHRLAREAVPSWLDSSGSAHAIAALWLVVGLLLVWPAVGAALGVLCYRRSAWGRQAMVGNTCVLVVVLLLSLPVSVANLIAAVATISLLLGAPARDWFAHREEEPLRRGDRQR